MTSHSAGDALAESLLQRPVPERDEAAGGRPYSLPGMILVSLFVAYHATLLVVYNAPSSGLTRGLHWAFDRRLAMTSYMRITGNEQNWELFAPDATQSNFFMRVLVEDRAGKTRDLQHDIYGRRTYPYLVYDRMGKVNRRIAQEETNLRPHYAAWVCRSWERTHGGERATAVRLVRLRTRIPQPEDAYRSMGYHPMGLELWGEEAARFDCGSIEQGQLPNHLRVRFGLPTTPDGTFRDVRVRTWHDDRAGPDSETDVSAQERPHPPGGG